MTNHSLLKSFLAFALFCTLLGPLMATQYTYSFTFKGKRQTVKLDLASSTINHYKGKTHYWPTSLTAYPKQANEDRGYEYLSAVATSLESQASTAGYTGWDLVQFTTAFVQNLTYISETQEYVRYPIETLKDKGGDCEDTAILLAALLTEMGYDAMLVHAPGHMMAAVACSNCGGATLEYGSKEYVLIETTAPVGMGHIDNRFASSKFTALELDASQGGEEVYAVNEPEPDWQQNIWEGSDDTQDYTVYQEELPAFINIQNIEDLMGFAGVMEFEGFEVVPGFVDMENMEGFEHFNIDPNDFFPEGFDQQEFENNGGNYSTQTTTTTSQNGTVTTTTVTTYSYEYRR